MEKKNFFFAAMFLVVFIDMLGLSIAIPIFAFLLVDPVRGIFSAEVPFQTKTIVLGFLLAVYPLAQFFGAPLLGALSDRHGRKKVLMLSIFGSLLGYMLFAVAIMMGNIPLLFFSRILAGFTGGNIAVVQSAIADVSDAKSRAKNFGLMGMAFGFGFILGPYVGGKLADNSVVSWFSYATPFWFAAVLSLINLILVVLIFQETLKVKIHKPLTLLTGFQNIHKAFSLKKLRTLFWVIFLLTLGFNFFTQFSPLYLIEKFAFGESQVGTIFGYIGLWIAITQGFIMRPVAKRFSSEEVLKFAPFMLAISLLLLVFPKESFWLWFIFPFVSIFQGLTYPNYTAVVSNLSDETSQGEILGINQSVQSLAMALPPIISGFIAAFHVLLPIVVSSVMVLFGWLIFILFFSAKKEEKFHEV